MQAVSCPTCGSGPKIMCKLSSGQPRKSAHRDRRLVAAEFWKTHPTAIEWLDWHFAIARCPLPRRYTYSTGGCRLVIRQDRVARLRGRQLPLYLFPIRCTKRSGKTWCPTKDSVPGKLVIISDALGEYAKDLANQDVFLRVIRDHIEWFQTQLPTVFSLAE